MKIEYKKMMLDLIKDVTINLTITAIVIFLVVFVLSQLLNIQLQISSTSLVLAIIGTSLAFAGNNFVADALGRYGSHGLPNYIWGNKMQSIGFALTIAAIIVK